MFDVSSSGLTAYKYAIYILSVKNAAAIGTPVAAFILSHETSDNLTRCLKAVRETSKVVPR
jgi:hypothetical protein